MKLNRKGWTKEEIEKPDKKAYVDPYITTNGELEGEGLTDEDLEIEHSYASEGQDVE
jgi:hypothetical protein